MFPGVWYICCSTGISIEQISSQKGRILRGADQRVAWGLSSGDRGRNSWTVYGYEDHRRENGCYTCRTSLEPGRTLSQRQVVRSVSGGERVREVREEGMKGIWG